MKKQLSEEQFRECVKELHVGSKTIDIAYGVLVLGKAQASYVKTLGLSKGAVCQAVGRVWSAFVKNKLPSGHVQVSAVLPEYQAYIVKRWERDALKRQIHR